MCKNVFSINKNWFGIVRSQCIARPPRESSKGKVKKEKKPTTKQEEIFSMSKKLIYYFKCRIEAQIQKMIPTNFCFPLLTQTFSIPLPFSHPYFLILMIYLLFPRIVLPLPIPVPDCPCSSLQHAQFFLFPAFYPSPFSSVAPPFYLIFSIPPLLVRSCELRSPPCHRRK